MASKPESSPCSGNSMEETYLLAMRCPVYRRRESIPGFRTELENLAGDGKGKAQADEPRGRKYRCAGAGADCSVVVLKRGNARGAKGAGHPRRDRKGQRATGGTRWCRWKAVAFNGWHEPCESRGSSTVLRGARVQLPGPTRRVGRTARCRPLSYSTGKSKPDSLRPPQRHQRISQDHALPAQITQREVIALRQVAPLKVGGQQVVGAGAAGKVRFICIARCAGCAFVDQIGRQSLGRPGKPVLPILPGGVGPGVRRPFHGPRICRHVLRGDGAGQPLEVQPALLPVIVV